MRKKFLSRIAAAGIAAFTAVSAMSFAASASVTLTAVEDDAGGESSATMEMTGTAHLVKWSLVKVTTSYTVNMTGTDDQVGTKATVMSPATSEMPLTSAQYTIGGSCPYGWVQGAGSAYYATQKNASDAIGKIDGIIKYYNDELTAAKTELNNVVKDYNAYWNAFATAQKNVKLDKDGNIVEGKATFTPVCGTKLQVTVVADSAISTTPKEAYYTKTEETYTPKTASDVAAAEDNAKNLPTYYYSVTPSSNATVTMTDLQAIFGKRVELEDGSGRIVPVNQGNGKKIFINATGSVASNNSSSSNNNSSSSSSSSKPKTHTENAVYRVGVFYYPTWSSAYAAAGNDESVPVWYYDYTNVGAYFSRLTGNFYSTYEAALSASGGNTTYIMTTGAGSTYYDDPYYYYYLSKYGSGSSSSSSSSNSNLGGASVTIGNKSGWSNVRSSISKAAAGTTLNVSMGNETSIPQEVLAALNGKNVTVNFTLKNGAVMSFNGLNVSSAKDIGVNVVYNNKGVATSLVNKAKSVNNAISSAQIYVSDNTFGATANMTIKFSSSRAGCTAKLYRYNTARNSLQLVSTSKIGNDGKVTFGKVTQGGDYVVVII